MPFLDSGFYSIHFHRTIFERKRQSFPLPKAEIYNLLWLALSPFFVLSRQHIAIFGCTFKWDQTQGLNVITSHNSPIILWARRAWKCAIQCPCYLKAEAPGSNKEESHATALSTDFESKKGSPCCLD